MISSYISIISAVSSKYCIYLIVSLFVSPSGFSPDWEKDDLASNPGLVAIICIFCIVLALVLVVLTVKCIRSPRSNFERLEDMPMVR